ncbi:MAG: cyclopropane-fatty-acyl-phospholipid synthase [Thermoleophilaceae bacterium]|jgi:cyclopropane-fatty-acyl-phospholipid synthase|nr:cyclopropane-fatty-acyl-phospholipid synthase [Thermoleophilaceae bacterium]
MLSSTEPFLDELARAIPSRPFSVELWDGRRLESTGGGPTFQVRSPDAFAHALRAPGQLGLGRAYVSGALAVDDLDEVLELLDSWQPPPLDKRVQARLALAAARASGIRRPPPVPTSELRPRGRRHSPERDARAVRHHYDVSNDFFKLFLGDSLTYSCALFSRGAKTLEEAQEAKLEMVCTKLALQPGQRVLDVGCGWGSFALHAAANHDVSVVGITLSEPQAALGRQRAAERGLSERVDIRVADYRALTDEPFDAVASIGMVEHVGNAQIDVYARQVARMVKPGGRVLNHGIARLRTGDPEAGPFSERYVFPDAAPLHLSRIQTALERAGLETEHVEGLRSDYAETLRHWARNLDDNIDEATRLAGAERIRVWRLYLRAARRGFESGFTSIYQVRCSRP